MHRPAVLPSTHAVRGSRLLTALLVAALTLATMVAAPPFVAQAQSAPSVTAVIDADERLLAGEDGVLRLSTTGADAWGYNLAFVVTAPTGLEPLGSSIGAPRVIAHPSDPGLRLWIFEDVADLPAGGTFDLDVDVRPVQPAAGGGETSDPAVFPVGSVADVRVDTYVSSDANLLPWFHGSSANSESASAPVTVSGNDDHELYIAALRVTKWEPSPESELLRGVHDHPTTYHVLVENTTEGVTADATLVDYLPAGLEFLGCGTIDNTTVDRAGTGSNHEYPGSGDLTGTPALAAMSAYDGAGAREGCLTPVEVVTVAGDPDAPSDAVYTRITWDLGDLPAGSVTELRYAAGIPLYENTADFDGAAGTPSGDSLGQSANLDNNNGPSTRQVGGHEPAGDGTVYRNLAEAAGDYEGVVRTGTDRAVSDDDEEIVHAMDLHVLKSADEDEFAAAGVATYRLHLRTSEYTSADEIVLTDTIPNGLCPLVPLGVTLTGDPIPTDCAPSDAHPSIAGATATELGYDAATGEFTLVLVPSGQPLAASDTHDVTYPVLMRGDYTDSGEYGPTTSLDTFDNHVTVIGDTTSIPPLVDWFPDTEPVWDDSAASLPTQATTISKQVAARDSVTADLPDGANPCPAAAGAYGDDDQPGFRMGDVACFELTVTFPTTVQTRNPVVTDILPYGFLDFVGWEAADAASAALLESDAFTATGRRLEWQVGTTGAGGDRYVPAGSVLRLQVWAEVTRPATGPAVDKPQNLMKYRQENVDGDVFFLRDQAAIDVEPGVSLLKGVRDVDGEESRPADSQGSGDGTVVDSNRDGIRVVEGEEVTYRVDLTAPDFPIANLVVWDSLPGGIACADVVALGTATCHDPGDAGFPTGLAGGHASRSVLVWTGLSIAAEASTSLLYTVEIPIGTSVSTRLVNTASITSYTSGTNVSSDPAAQTYYPQDSLDTDLEDDWNAPGGRARDDSDVYLPSATVTKDVTTEVLPADDPNNGDGQAVTGELITYTYAVTVPAHTTVYDGVLSDGLPASLTLFDVLGWTFDDGSGPVAGTLPGFDVETDVDEADAGSLTFAPTYRNDSDDPHVFAVTIRAYVASGHSLSHGQNLPNTAVFSSNQSPGGPAWPNRTANETVQYIEPAPRIDKAVTDVSGDAPSTTPPVVDAGDEVTYTLTVTNLDGRPISHDTVVVDCLPAGIVFDRYGTPPAGVTTVAPVAGDGTNGCDDGTTRLGWGLGAVADSDTVELTYVVTIDPSVGGGSRYVNEADVVGHTLPENPTSGDRGDADDDTDAVVEVVGAAIVKGVTPSTAAVGEQVAYDVTVTLPADVNFYDARIVDEVPAGIAVSAATCTPSDPAITCTAPDPATTDGGTDATLTWELGNVTSAATARTVTITYSGTVVTTDASTADALDPVDGDQLTNLATLSWRTLPGSGGEERSEEDDATVTVVEPELTIVKLVDGEDHQDVLPGDPFTYTVEVANVGTSTAHDVTITDDVPLGVVVDADSISHGGQLTGVDDERGNGTITWTLDTLAVGPDEAVTFSYDATLAPSETLDTSTLDNVASVDEYFSADDTHDARRSYEGPDDDAGVTPRFPSVTVAKDVTDGRDARVGEPFGWTITVTSDGDADAHEVTVVDTLPHGWDYDTTVNVAVDGASVLPTPQPTVATTGDGRTTLTWNLGILAVGEVATIAFTTEPTTDAYVTPGAGVGVDNLHVNDVEVSAEDPTGAESNGEGPYGGDPDDADAFLVATNVTVDKDRVGDGEIRVGDDVTFSITARNTGDQPAADVQVTDTLPAGLTFEGVATPLVFDDTVWDCVLVDRTVTCDLLADLPAGGSESFSLTARTEPAAAPSVTNVAEVTTSTPETDPDDNDDPEEVPVTPIADLRLLKSVVSPDVVVAGEPITWQIDVRNLGPSTSVAPITVVDTLPDEVSGVTVDAPGWTCAEVVDQVLACVLGTDLPVDTNAPPITITATVDPSYLSAEDGPLVNHAIVSGTTEDPDPDNDEDEVTVIDTETSADLAIAKSLASDTLVAGEGGRYRLEIDNLGPSDARNVTVVDQLPAGLAYAGEVTAADGDTWTCAAVDDEVQCELRSEAGTLAAGASTWLEFDVTVASWVTETVRNVATVDSTTPDPNPDNDEDDEETPPTVVTNLSVTKSHDGQVRRVGDEVTFTLVVTNHGPADAADVVVVDTLPDGLTFADVDTPFSAGDDWSCAVDVEDGRLTCELSRTLPADPDAATEILEVTARVTPAAHPEATNVVTVETSTDETTLEDNDDEDTVEVAPLVDLAVTKDVDVDELVVGETATYTITVTNNGPTADPGPVTLVDALPEGLTYASHTGADCEVDGRQLECVLGALEVGQSVTVTVVVDVEPVAYPEVTNVAEVRTPSEDTDPDNDHDDVTTPVRPDIGFEIVKTRGEVDGDQVTWTLAVTNTGRNVADQGFVVTDELPDELRFVSADGGDFACEVDGQIVTCTYTGQLDPGASATVRLVTEVDAAAGATITNVARVDGPDGSGIISDEDAADHEVPVPVPPEEPPSGERPEVEPSATDDPPATARPDRGRLAFTGAALNVLVALTLVLLGVGALLIVRTRRRRT